MNFAAFAVKNRATVYFAYVVFAIAGAASFFSLGQLEDPEFAVKSALVSVSYPGASAEEIELEVVDRIEIAIQELPQLDYVESWSSPGQARIVVEIKEQYWAPELPQIWDELRRKMNDVRTSLPPGAEDPVVTDDFGDVFGFQLALVGDGYTGAEMEEFAKGLRKELSIVEGVARADLWGVQQKVVYLDTSETQLSELGISDSSIENTLRQQNMVVDAGNVDVGERRLRISPTGEFRSPEDIGELTIRPSLADSLQNSDAGGLGVSAERSSELIRIRDIGTVRQGYVEPPFTMMRYNGRPAIGLSITNLPGANVVTVGQNIDQRLAELIPTLPVGIEVRRVHWMSDVVAEAVNGFVVSFAQAVGIVLVVLTLFMGWRMSLIIGMALVMTILGTFILMALAGTDLQRMSLGALIIALGMMVDNAIVVADGMVVRLKQGMDREQAAIESAAKPSLPLLGATVIAVMAFYPIFGSDAAAGEYCRTLFTVVAMALLTSWLVSVTLTPLQCIDMVPDPKDEDGADPFGGGFYAKFRALLEKAIRFRWLTIGGAVALLVVSGVAFGNVTQLFFPDSSMDKFMIDFYATKGTRIQQVADELEAAEKKLMADDRVMEVAAFIGAGPPRFYLPVEPEPPDQSYAQLIVNVHDFRTIDDLIAKVTPWLEKEHPNTIVVPRKYAVGPSTTWSFETRISGPASAEPGVLRSLAAEGTAILEKHPLAGKIRTDWRRRVTKLEPQFAQERARWASVTRDDIARTTMRAYDGRNVGLYREGDDLLPIILRLTDLRGGGRRSATIDSLQVQPEGATVTIPMPQVTDGVPVAWEDPIVGRRDRRRTITVQANPIQGVTLPTLHSAVLADFDALAAKLPPGYTMEWGGEHEQTLDSQASLIPGFVPMAIVMLLIVVALFNAYRPPLAIFATVPFAAIGITWGLLIFDVPFGFVALLGAMSLVGMMIKNAIVLLDECNAQLDEGKDRYEAIIYAALSRLRPVVLAAATTVLGVMPLLQDVFWIGLAVVLMAGLTFGTLLTMVLVPVLYSTIYKLRPGEEENSPAS